MKNAEKMHQFLCAAIKPHTQDAASQFVSAAATTSAATVGRAKKPTCNPPRPLGNVSASLRLAAHRPLLSALPVGRRLFSYPYFFARKPNYFFFSGGKGGAAAAAGGPWANLDCPQTPSDLASSPRCHHHTAQVPDWVAGAELNCPPPPGS